MKNMKLVITTIFTVIIITILSSIAYAGTVSSLSATENNGKITVSGTVDSTVYAVAVVVYSEDNLEYMETANVNSDRSYSIELGKQFGSGTYEVRAADYNGGEYKTTSVEVKSEENTTSSSNPTTGDIIMIFVGIFVVSTAGFVITRKLSKRK